MKKSVLVTIGMMGLAFIGGFFTHKCNIPGKIQAWAEDVKEGMNSEEKPEERQPAEKPEERKTETPVSEAAEEAKSDEEKKG